ncbi:hypothetical protein FNV43_RR24443 [Rhamnella rubrinervis]|uniref:Uncharacterized protein n=1 Tax=Rhamnella rubrinervis TaxID=2594499 RepID=A0A8K0DMS6_9ROSA|nr:hypothetical protein FNV43_RR24443 [Rhamnella rubrinervis]
MVGYCCIDYPFDIFTGNVKAYLFLGGAICHLSASSLNRASLIIDILGRSFYAAGLFNFFDQFDCLIDDVGFDLACYLRAQQGIREQAHLRRIKGNRIMRGRSIAQDHLFLLPWGRPVNKVTGSLILSQPDRKESALLSTAMK